ncbi:type II toxin-antitoxin system Phd/YefM family antitoxin [uncultured Corynebacterium sp.]|uniref:type II toxin-antitoxin system Phd/YefM family antitoxin n=1 Tax=uncultured Corynebacterium sp. TaxID=159447 RepID=UPI0025F44349|nr:type II toxin-antitoxin system Phd/YefM family antitoxin [uncultured Corynebacterium sp.]
MTTMPSRTFNQDVSSAKRSADAEPLIITDRGRPAYVLMTIDDYRDLTGDTEDLLARLSMGDEDADDIDFDPAPVSLGLKVPEL